MFVSIAAATCDGAPPLLVDPLRVTSVSIVGKQYTGRKITTVKDRTQI